MSDDELKRVQAIADALSDSYQNGVNEGLEFGKTERERLREENARMREALEPFAKMADELDDEWENEGMHWIDCHQFEHVPTVGDLRAARAAIQDGKTKHVP